MTKPDTDNGVQFLDIDSIELDAENPRLPESVARDQQAMLDYIAETTSIEELMQAIGENDYFSGEPIIVIPNPKQNGKYIVVEGNRRLTAVKLLHNPSIISQPSNRLIEVSKNADHKPERIPAVIKKTRQEVLPYLGYRHITGVKQWEPLAKARYIKQLFDLTPKALPTKERYTEVGRAIGSRRDHIKRNLDALAVYNVIESHEFYGIDDLDDQSIKFSLLSTALADERIALFTGTSSLEDNEEITPNDPITDPSHLRKKEIEELTKWLFERDEKGRTKVGESRNIKYLSATVANERALSALRQGSPLRIAYQFTADITQDFGEMLYQAEATLSEAASMVATVAYSEDAYETAKRILEHIKLIGKTLKDKKKPEDDEF